jgi:hypothetical protein
MILGVAVVIQFVIDRILQRRGLQFVRPVYAPAIRHNKINAHLFQRTNRFKYLENSVLESGKLFEIFVRE